MQEIGEGGFAEIHLREHKYLERRVAIKELTITLTAEEFNHFMREAQTIAELEHPLASTPMIWNRARTA
jgi:serine/threonine protein kinase